MLGDDSQIDGFMLGVYIPGSVILIFSEVVRKWDLS